MKTTPRGGTGRARPRDWMSLRPRVVENATAWSRLKKAVSRLRRVRPGASRASAISNIRSEESDIARSLAADWAAELVLCINVLCDLRAQGWRLRLETRKRIGALPPASHAGSVDQEKERIRTAHLIERDAQLAQISTRRFIREMEVRRPFQGSWHSIFSLMRDGRDLASLAREIARLPGDQRNRELGKLIDPYVQVVTPRERCAHTGLPLQDIWRYFRHTWSTTYQSTPGRKMFFLVRDRSVPNHPVVGIGALGSAVVQLSVRDDWVGWTGAQIIEEMRQKPTAAWARWLDRSLQRLIDEVMVTDFLREGILKRGLIARPTEEVVARLALIAKEERAVHHLYPALGLHKQASASHGVVDWKAQAKTHLFRSKRAKALAALLEARRRLRDAGFVRTTATALKRALRNPSAARAIQVVLRRVKGTNVGIHIMDITVCGAIAPYNHLIGGKLVSLLMASPTVITAYNRRYRKASSVIASSIAGRALVRHPHLVLLGTTSLYGVGASQYNRLRMPARAAGGDPDSRLAYLPLGKTVGYGSYHFSAETMTSIDPVLRRLQRGRPVNSIFGEGVNPKLRKVRGALDAVGLPSDLLLQHGSPRIVYAVPVASNFRDVLLDRTQRPRYILPETEFSTAAIADYWRERWLNRRIESDEILSAIAEHTIAYPVRHGARVVLPADDDAEQLFAPRAEAEVGIP